MYPGRLWEYWQESMRRKEREICILLCLERTWERCFHLENIIHSKELDSALLRHRIKKKSGFSVHSIRIHSEFKHFPFWRGDSYAGCTGYVWTEAVSGKKKLPIQKYPDTCELGFNLSITATFLAHSPYIDSCLRPCPHISGILNP